MMDDTLKAFGRQMMDMGALKERYRIVKVIMGKIDAAEEANSRSLPIDAVRAILLDVTKAPLPSSEG